MVFKLFHFARSLFAGSKLNSADPHCMRVYMDVTHHCNARCCFCFNDWEALHPKNMEEGIMQKCFRLMPLAQKHEFYLSCLFEPTLHPDFFRWLRGIDPSQRENIQFTTNLLKNIPDGDLEFLANAGFGLVNISLETLDENLCQKIMGVGSTAFFQNIEKLSGYARRAKNPTAFRFLTMVLRDNCAELPAIAKRTWALFPGSRHEFRTPFFYVKSESRVIGRDSLVPKEEYRRAISALRRARPRTETDDPDPLTQERYDEILGNTPLEALREIQRQGGGLPDLSIRVAADGTGLRNLGSGPEPFDLKEIDDPRTVFCEPVSEANPDSDCQRMGGACIILKANHFDGRWLYIHGIILGLSKHAPKEDSWFFVLDGDFSRRFKAFRFRRCGATQFEGLIDLGLAAGGSGAPDVSLCSLSQGQILHRKLPIGK
jgi:hypothetical protein